jgi:hypothetical protein
VTDTLCTLLAQGVPLADIIKRTGATMDQVLHVREENRARIEQERSEIAEEVGSRMVSLSHAAAVKLVELMHCGNLSVELGAARVILTEALRWRGEREFERRLMEVESLYHRDAA